VHIPKEMAIFPNSHTKSDQGAIEAHNCHMGRYPKIWSLGTSSKCDIYIFGLRNGSRAGSYPRGGCLKGGRKEQLDLGLRPFMGISLANGVRNT
jgi:hypothetical protein